MLQYIKKLSTTLKILFIGVLFCIVICMGIIFWYSNINIALLDNISYYDKNMNFHYWYGFEKPISCMLYIIILSIILIMIKLIVKFICPNSKKKKSIYFVNFVICIFLYGILVYNLFNLKIGHIIVSGNGFYNIDNLIIKSNFEEYSYNYFDNHFPQLLDKRVFFCETKSDYTEWKQDLFLGYYSDNIYELTNELDYRTEYKYQLTSTLKKTLQQR